MQEKILILRRINSSLNLSKSKVAYSFSKAKRFQNNKLNDFKFRFYNLPSMRSNRSTSFGYGKKINFEKLSENKCNILYNLPSSFDPKFNNSPKYSFGYKISINKNNSFSPGPKYYTREKIGEDSPSYSLGKKLNQIINQKNNLPGPGSYNLEKKNSRNLHSTIFSNMNIFLNTKEKRFKCNSNISPGPGDYFIPSLINKNGFIYDSRYKSSTAKSILGKINYSSKSIENNIGPGQYSFFSEFEGYSNKDYTIRNQNKLKKIHF